MAHNPTAAALLAEAIRLELNMAALYMTYHHALAEDAGFWWQLAVEEKNHAALLRSVEQLAEIAHGFPADLLPVTTRELGELNARIEAGITAAKAAPPARAEALGLALELERSAGEAHFQDFIEASAGESLGRIFRNLNREDKDHARRIEAYRKQQGFV